MEVTFFALPLHLFQMDTQMEKIANDTNYYASMTFGGSFIHEMMTHKLANVQWSESREREKEKKCEKQDESKIS